MSDDLLCPKCSATNPSETIYCGKCGSKLATSADKGGETDPLVGAFVGDRFLVHEKLGEGGMGVVYRAEQTAIERKVALKVLHAHLTRDESLHARFQNEAAACSRLTHPNTVTIYDFGKTAEDSLYIAMEYIDGKSLDDEIRDCGKIPWVRACRIAIQICGSLSDAHRHNIVHRDLKPENIMLCERGGESDVVKVLDFGIAKIVEDEGTDQRQALTKTGMVFGTPQYMSPEQIRGEKVDFRTDIYSLGVILYEMLTGVLPFTSDVPMGVLSKHLFDTPPPMVTANSSVQLPDELESLVMSALDKEADKRPESMLELKRRLAVAADFSQENTLISAAATVPAAANLPSVKPKNIAERMRSPIPSTVMQTADSDLELSSPKRTGLIVGIVLVVLVLVGGGVGFLLYNSGEADGVFAALTGGDGDSLDAPDSAIDTSKFPDPRPLEQSPKLGAVTAQKGKTTPTTTPQAGKGTNGNKPKKKKDVPCTYSGDSDSVSMAIRAGLRRKEAGLKKCVKNNSGGSTVFSFIVPAGTNEPKRIRLVTSTVMDSCLGRLLKSKFDGKSDKKKVGKASFSLERRGGVLRKCEIEVNTQLKRTIGPFIRPGKVIVPQKPGNKDNKEDTKERPQTETGNASGPGGSRDQEAQPEKPSEKDPEDKKDETKKDLPLSIIKKD